MIRIFDESECVAYTTKYCILDRDLIITASHKLLVITRQIPANGV
jgi:hypothetical protein